MWKWPEEVVAWLRDNVPGRTTKEVTALINEQGFNKKYGMLFTEAAIKGAKTRYHLQSGTPGGFPKGYSLKYPEGMEEYIRSIASGRTTAEISKMTEEYFGIEFPASACRAYKKNHDIISGLDCRFEKGHIPDNKGKKMSAEVYAKVAPTMFQKGNVPANHIEVGEYTHTTDGYLVQKVREDGIQRERFEFVHRREWEENYGPIPDGKMVSFLDGNKDNCLIENLVLIDNEENLELNRSRLRFENPECTKVGVTVAKMKITARKRRGKKVQNEHGNERDY